MRTRHGAVWSAPPTEGYDAVLVEIDDGTAVPITRRFDRDPAAVCRAATNADTAALLGAIT